MALKTDYLDDAFTGNKQYRITSIDYDTSEIEDITEYDTEGDIFSSYDINATNTQVNLNIPKETVISLTTTWETSSATTSIPFSHYTQTILIDGVTEDTVANISISPENISGVLLTADEMSTLTDEWAKVAKAHTVDGGITFIAYEVTIESVDLLVHYGG